MSLTDWRPSRKEKREKNPSFSSILLNYNPLFCSCAHNSRVKNVYCFTHQASDESRITPEQTWSSKMGQASIPWRTNLHGWRSVFNITWMEWRSSNVRIQRLKGRLGNRTTRALLGTREDEHLLLTKSPSQPLFVLSRNASPWRPKETTLDDTLC